MKLILVITLFFFISLGVSNCFAQKLPIWDDVAESFEIKKGNQEVVLVHYFATWCAPCMKELPVFDSLRKVLSLSDTQFVFISMDLKNTKKLAKTLSNLRLPGKVFYLSPTSESNKIIHPTASGALPTTVIYYPFGEPILIEGKMTMSEYLKLLP